VLIRALLAAVALTAVLLFHMICPWWGRTSTLVLLGALSIGSVVSLHLGKMATGTLAILLSIAIPEAVETSLSRLASIGLVPAITRFDYVRVVLIICLIGVSSALLYTRTDFRVWHLLGSLGIFGVLLLSEFYGERGHLQAVEVAVGILTTFSWLVGLAVGAAIRH
jgi:general stress protein CsbA